MTLQRSGGAAAFSTTAEAYAETMAPALLPVAKEVVRRAALQPGEVVLDLGTGTGNAAGLAAGDGRRVIGLDGAAGMLEIARREVPDVEFIEADFTRIPLEEGSIDVVIGVHALLFADDRVAALADWLRVTAAGGRLSLSVPGPGTVVPTAVFGDVYLRYGLTWGNDYPTGGELAGWAREAGWSDVRTAADPTAAIPLRDDEHFRTWLRVGSRGRATGDWSDERREAFARDLMEVAPRDAEGGYRLPFGALFLTALKAA
ncbi:MAG: class I SAM-dependent methyltransferase [Candidatus Limnocylindria bacterium]